MRLRGFARASPQWQLVGDVDLNGPPTADSRKRTMKVPQKDNLHQRGVDTGGLRGMSGGLPEGRA